MFRQNPKIIWPIVFTFLIASHITVNGASRQWSTYAEPDYGLTVNYPTDVFVPNPQAKAYKHGKSFVSKNGQAELIVNSTYHPNRDGAAAVVKHIKAEKTYDEIITLNLKPFKYELKARLKDRLVLDYGIFSCREHIYNRVRLIYPQGMENDINQFLPKMKRRMSAGIGAKTPVRDCN